MMANEAYSFISSRLVKEVFSLGGNITGLVPPSVEARLNARLSVQNPVLMKGRSTLPCRQLVNPIADRISSISVSSTMKVAADAEKLRSEGVDVVDFGAGEPDFPTPDNIKQAAVRALEQNFTKYTAGRRHGRTEEGRLRAPRRRISAPTTSPTNASSPWAASTSSSTSCRR